MPDRIIETMIRRYESQDMSPELFLYGFFSEFLTDDMELLESYERKLFCWKKMPCGATFMT